MSTDKDLNKFNVLRCLYDFSESNDGALSAVGLKSKTGLEVEAINESVKALAEKNLIVLIPYVGNPPLSYNVKITIKGKTEFEKQLSEWKKNLINFPERPDLAKVCLDLIDGIFNCGGVSTEETKAFQNISHEGLCQAFQYWLEQMRIIMGEPVNIVITQSLRDEGIDVLIEFLKSKVKIGFQIKSYNDVQQKTFTQSCVAQISRSKKHGVFRLIMAIGADMTDSSQKEKVRGLTSEISQMDDYCKVFSPEKTLTIYQTFEKKVHPITKIEGKGDIALIIHELQKKLSQDPYYEHKIDWTAELKDNAKHKDYPIKFNLITKNLAGSKTLLDLLKEAELTGKPVTIPKENIETFEVFKDGALLIPKDSKVDHLTITAEKPEVVLTLEVNDLGDDPPLVFESLRFVIDATVGSTVHFSTHENNYPYIFSFSLENEKNIGNFSISIQDSANAKHRYNLLRLLDALNAGKELVFKNADRQEVSRVLTKSNPEMAVPEAELRLFRDLSYIQDRTISEISVPDNITQFTRSLFCIYSFEKW
jgi:hypothetical protein